MTDNNNDQSVPSEQQIKELKELYKRLLESSDFEKLELELQKPNIFSILGIGRKEIRHSNFLAWLLNPNETHGLGNRLLIRVLRDLSIEDKTLDILDINKLNFSDVEVNREYKTIDGSIDILIVFRNDKLVICIENKFDTEDSKKQLKKYREYVKDTFKKEDGYKRNILVYLTPDGTDPKDPKEVEKWHNYSYREIIDHLKPIQDSMPDSTIKTYISDYLTTLKREIMETNDFAREFANAIYKEHKKIIDFVVDNKESDKEYEDYWENNHTFVLEFVKKLKGIIEKNDKINKYVLEYMGKKSIKIKQKNKTQNKFAAIYYIWKGAGENCNMEFNFSTKDDEDGIRNSVKKIVEKYNSTGVTCSDGAYFKILGVNKLSEEELKKIHLLRFPTDNPNNQ